MRDKNMDRKKLPYRKNCEGYFLFKGKVLAKYTEHGFLLFPGGGVDEGEDPEDALKREAFEETGAIIKEPLKKIKVIHFDWGSTWAKTEKQKKRYEKFKGEEMHLFFGKVERLEEPAGDPEDAWKGEVTMDIKKAIELIKSENFSEDLEEYRGAQIIALKDLIKNAE